MADPQADVMRAHLPLNEQAIYDRDVQKEGDLNNGYAPNSYERLKTTHYTIALNKVYNGKPYVSIIASPPKKWVGSGPRPK